MPSDTTIGLLLLGITLVLLVLVLVLILWVRLAKCSKCGMGADEKWAAGRAVGYEEGHTAGYLDGYRNAQTAGNERAIEAAFVRGQQNMARRMYEIFDTAHTKSFDIMEAALDAAAELIDDTKNEEEKPNE